jgi:hypothetical protein
MSDQSIQAPEGVREVQCSLLSPHGAHGETFPDEPERSWWCPGVEVTW